jgi:hypothetical protein
MLHIPKRKVDGTLKTSSLIKNPKSTVQMQNGQTIHFIRQNKLRIPVDKEAIIKK